MELQDFPAEIIHKIFRNLSFRERVPLQLVSKSIRQAVIDAPCSLKNVQLFEICRADGESARHRKIKLSVDEIRLTFYKSKNGKSTVVLNDSEEKLFIEESDYLDVAMEFLRKNIFKKNVTCETFDTDCLITESSLESLSKLNTRRIRFFDTCYCLSSDQKIKTPGIWLKHLNPKYLKSMTMYNSDSFCNLNGFEGMLHHVETIHIIRRNDVNDDILDSLTALDIELDSGEITVNGINRLIQKWVNQKVPCGSRFVYYDDDNTKFPMEKLIENIPSSVKISNEMVNFAISSDSLLRVYLTDSSVEVECMKKK
ncbi:unnamed protein product [Caenorhabditis brenneri]